MIKAIIVNDFRVQPIFTCIEIFKKCRSTHKVIFVISQRHLKSYDYGQYLPFFLKKAYVIVLKLIGNVEIIGAERNTKLDSDDLKGIESSLQSMTSNSNASKDNYQKLYQNLHQQAMGAKEIYNKIILKYTDVHFFVFNGRTASSSIIAIYSHRNKNKISYYEYGINCETYRLLPYSPHNSRRLGLDVFNLRKKSILRYTDIYKNGYKWEIEKLSNKFTKNYKVSIKKIYDVVVFLGSDHEYTNVQKEIVDFDNMGNLNFLKAVHKKYEGKKISVRAHPNQISDMDWKNNLYDIENFCISKDIDYYAPDSHVNSYELIKNSKVIAVEYSSIAYDALLMGKEVDIFGALDVKYIMKSLPEFIFNNLELRAQHIREIMSFYNYLYVNYFSNKSIRLFLKFLMKIESLYLLKFKSRFIKN